MMKKKSLKLSFDKETISKLQQKELTGGLVFTTSFGNCTGFLCCTPEHLEPTLVPYTDTDCGEIICKL